jgi:SEC-C motif
MRSPAWAPAGSDGRYRYEVAAVVVFWPQAQYEAVIARWPQLVEHLGATWEEHRQRTERDCAVIDRDGLAVNQMAGDVGDFAAFLARRGATRPDKDDLHAYPDLRDATAEMVAWPPDRTGPCWCGSRRKYKQCCRPHGLGTLH